jgi:hypothetical protein
MCAEPLEIDVLAITYANDVLGRQPGLRTAKPFQRPVRPLQWHCSIGNTTHCRNLSRLAEQICISSQIWGKNNRETSGYRGTIKPASPCLLEFQGQSGQTSVVDPVRIYEQSPEDVEMEDWFQP